MSKASTRTLWKVRVEEGTVYSQRTYERLFTNERAANAVANAFNKHLPLKNLDVSVEEVEAEMYVEHAIWDASSYLFPELRAAVDGS